MPAAHTLAAHSAIRTHDQAFGWNQLQRLPQQISDFIRTLDLQRVVIDDADGNLLPGNLLTDSLEVHRIRTFHLKCDDVRIDLVEDFERGFIRLYLREHALLRWISPAAVHPYLGFAAQTFYRVVEHLQHEIERDVFIRNRTRGKQVNLRILYLNHGTTGIRE